jgi:glutathione S-transferase
VPDELTFYTNPMSRGRIVRWMLEEIGQPYRTQVIEYGPPMKSPEYLAINPMGKVPAIRHGGAVVSEAAAICTYLADAFPEAGLAPPPGDPLRGPYYRWMFFGAGPVEAAATAKSFGFVAPPGKEGMLGYGTYDAVIDTLDRELSTRTYFVGDRFTAVDVYLGCQIGWGMTFGSIEKRPSFERYWERLSNRPACLRARQIDDELMPPGQALPG